MKTKKIAFALLLLVITLGIGLWLFFSFQSTPKNDESKPPGNSQVDTTAPSVTLNITAEALERAQTEKVLDVSVDANDNKTVIKVEYLLDGKVVARSIESPFRVMISLASLASGTHTLQAIAYDAAGNSGKSNVFTFVIEEEAVTPANDESRTIIQSGNRISGRAAGTTVPPSGSNPAPNPGGNPDPDPDPDSGRAPGGWYSSLPVNMQICSNNSWNSGSDTPPAGAITVPAGDNAGFNFSQSGKTFWFAPGVHYIGPGIFSNIVPGDDSTYIGAPGAIIDGQYINRYAFAGNAQNVRLAYLEIRNFGVDTAAAPDIDPVNNNEGVINHDASDNWIMEHIYAHHNDGAAVFLGSNNIVRYNCLKDNGQYGFSMFKPPIVGDSAIKNIVIDHNEIVGNNQDDWEELEDGCGCTGAGKFWDVKGATVTNNYVHGNLSTGLWADTNDIDFLFDSNWIEGNSGEGIWYEISYNATISRNVIKRNAWESGSNNTGSPGAAVYISESGGDSRLQSSTSGSSHLRINNNLVEDNFSGISIYENSNRFCNSNGNTSKGYCTPFVLPVRIPEPHNFVYPNPINNTHPCYTLVASNPYTTDCRWHSNNIQVFNNEFRFNPEVIPCTGTYCGAQALYATGADNIPWAPEAYDVVNIQNDVMFNNNNKFYNNHYVGNWRFAWGFGGTINFSSWRADPFHQDGGSTYVSTPIANIVDEDTSTLEGSIGEWIPWYGATVMQSTTEAHTGTHSLQATVTTGGDWAAELNNWPGYEVVTPNNKRVSFWAKQGNGTIPSVSLRVYWYDRTQDLLNENDEAIIIPINSLSTNWQQATLDLTPPPTATTVFIRLGSTSGSPGDTLFADDFKISDIP